MNDPITKRLDKRLHSLPRSAGPLLSQLDQLKGQWLGGAQLSPQVLGRLKRSVLATSTGASTRIEGAKLSDAEVEKLMRGLKTQTLDDRDEQEVRGYYEVLQLIFDQPESTILTENTILDLHARMLKHTAKDARHRGAYKSLENSVEMKDSSGKILSVLFKTTPAYLTPKYTQELLSWTQQALREQTHHPLLITANFVVEFLKIHPFLDGNGRLSRILTNLLLIQSGFVYMPYVSLEKLIEESKLDYYLALRASQTTFNTPGETVWPWVEFFLNTCLAQAEEAIGLLSGDAVQRTLSPNQLLVWHYMQSVDEATIRETVSATNVARPTVKQAFDRLLELKLVERLGMGRSTRYKKH